MSPLIFLAIAGGVIWLGFGLYLAVLAAAQRRLARGLKRLENIDHDQ